MSTFEAGVQYNDFTGTVAADRADEVTMRTYLIEQGIVDQTEWIVGYRFGFHGNHGTEVEKPGMVVYLRKGDFDNPGDVVRAVEIDMPTAKFFSFFKRFDLVMTEKGFSPEGFKVEGPDYD